MSRDDELNAIETRAGQINAKIDDGTITPDELAELSTLALNLRRILRGEPSITPKETP